MLKILAFTVALGAGGALLVADAGALPLAQGKQTVGSSSDITLVREGCGPGRQYSNRLRRCVEDSPGAMIRDAIRDSRDGRDRCGPGRHYSMRFQRCIRN
jgi:hypothetical protein